MTDAPETDAPETESIDAARIDELVAEWKAELDGQVSVSASAVQDRLLDLWGHLGESDARARVERWLTETLVRQLYTVSDIDARLDQVLSNN